MITINRIKPGASEELPEDQKQAAAAALYNIIVDPGSDMMGGFASQLLPSLGASAVPTILRLLEHDNPRIRAAVPRDVYRSALRDDRINAVLSKMARADKEASVRIKAPEALPSSASRMSDPAQSSLPSSSDRGRTSAGNSPTISKPRTITPRRTERRRRPPWRPSA